jgi:hypothetical protein
MRAFWKWALVLAVPAVGATAARAADEDTLPDTTTAQLILLRQKSVQQELKLTPEVVKKVMDFTDKEAKAYLDDLKLKGDEREKKIDDLEKDNKKFIEDNLSADQRKRLEQIALQVTGLIQITKPETVKLLKLTDDQQAKFKELQTQARKDLEEIEDAKGKEGRNEKLAKLHEDINKKIEAVLTADQKAKVKELIGEPFKGELVFEEDEGGATKDKDKPEK